MKFYNIFSSLRPVQWVKNLIIFIPIFSSHLLEPKNFFFCFIGFISFSLAASSCYILNDFLDQKKDKFHPINKNRPIAAGKINNNDILIIQLVLFFFNLLILHYLNNKFFFYIIFIYYLLNIFYSFKLKKIFFIDIILLSSFYVIRIIGGKFLIFSEISFYLLIIMSLTFFSISCLKRYSEIVSKNFDFKNSTRAYNIEHKRFLIFLSLSCIIGSSIILFFYLLSDEANNLYNINKYLAFFISFIYLIWGFLTNINFYKLKKAIDPTKYFLSDKITILFIIAICIIYYVSSI